MDNDDIEKYRPHNNDEEEQLAGGNNHDEHDYGSNLDDDSKDKDKDPTDSDNEKDKDKDSDSDSDDKDSNDDKEESDFDEKDKDKDSESDEKDKDSDDKKGKDDKKKGPLSKLIDKTPLGKLLGGKKKLGFKDILKKLKGDQNKDDGQNKPPNPLNRLQKFLRRLKQLMNLIKLYLKALRLLALYRLYQLLQAVINFLIRAWQTIVTFVSTVFHAVASFVGVGVGAVATAFSVTGLVIALAVGGAAAHNYAGQHAQEKKERQADSAAEQCENVEKKAAEENVDGAATSGTDGDWTKKGTKAYNNAKATFKAWVDAGASGAAAAGIVGWVNSEGGFSIIDRAEGHYGTDEKSNGIAYGVTPTPSGGGYSVGGGGIYQFTPYTKFAKLNDKKWLSASEQTKYVINMVKNGDWNTAMDLTGGNHSFVGFATSDDPQSATLMWNAYERGNVGYIKPAQKKADAKKAYEMFNGSKYKADKSKLGGGKTAGGAASAGGGNADVDDNTQKKKDECDAAEGKSDADVNGSWSWPFKAIKNDKPQISGEQLFGHSASRTGNFHDGVDFGTVPYGNSDILAIHGGKVIKIDHQGSTQNDLGYYVVTYNEKTKYYVIYQEFAFTSDAPIKVHVGDTVKVGDKIGTLSDKYTNVTHVHIGVTKTEITKALGHSFKNDGTWIDPVKTIKEGEKNN